MPAGQRSSSDIMFSVPVVRGSDGGHSKRVRECKDRTFEISRITER